MSRTAQRRRWLQRLLFPLVVVTALLLQGAYLANMVLWRDAPDRGFLVDQTSGLDRIASLRPLGQEAGLRVGDRILSINGETYRTVQELRRLVRSEAGTETVYRGRCSARWGPTSWSAPSSCSWGGSCTP
jgi:membrane-associated protease RseP (regulator of RpoE activity)